MQAEYPDQPLLRQTDTKRRRRERLDPSESTAQAAREANGWTPQSEASGVIPFPHASNPD